jgi:hypothetical protein
LRVYNETSHSAPWHYRTASGVEIDFIIESRKRHANGPAHLVAVEVKRAEKWNRSWESGLRNLASQEGVKVDRLIAVYTGTRTYHFEGLDVLPVSEFLQRLYQGKVF